MAKLLIGLRDGSFPSAKSATLAGDNLGQGPTYFDWDREGVQPVIFFTDICLEQAVDFPDEITKIAWLLEPEEINEQSYKFVRKNGELFDYRLTWQKKLIGEDWLFYPFGGSWISDRRIGTKTKLVSLIASEKNEAPGHILRHTIAKRYAPHIDIYGRGYKPIVSKTEGLADYCFSIVTENTKADWWITEKLIDCFSVGTIPIYWGCSDLKYLGFNPAGVCFFDDSLDLAEILNSLSIESYKKSLVSVHQNHMTAQLYYCAEDWIFCNYPFLFRPKL